MEFINFFGEAFSLLIQLLVRYLTHGFFFAVLHGYVAARVIYALTSKFRTETRALTDWEPHASRPADDSTKGEITKVLDNFIEESEKLGPKGFFVPMTDYSDRLDSIVDGLIAELHDRTNLFILIAIAGTLFGVFEFAFKAQGIVGVGSGDQVSGIGGILAESMAKAFPVGFMGLLLTFFFQQRAGTAEKRLREALSKATNKAIQFRKQVSSTEGQVVQEAAEEIRLVMQNSALQIQQSMEPLKDLKTTLAEGLQPVVATFSGSLDQTLVLVREQSFILNNAAKSIGDAVTGLQNGVSSIETAAWSLRQSLKDAPIVLERIHDLQDNQRLALARFDKSLSQHLTQTEQIKDGLEKATQGLILLPGALLEGTRGSLDEISKESIHLWTEMLSELRNQSSSDYISMLDGIRTQAAEIKGSISEVSQQLNQVAGNAASALNNLTDLPSSVIAEMDKTFGGLSDNCLKVWANTSDQFGKDVERYYRTYVEGIRAETEKINKSLGGVKDTWESLAANSNTLLERSVKSIVSEARTELDGSLRHLDQLLASQVPEASKGMQRFTDELKQLFDQANEIQKEYANLLNNARNTQERVGDIYGQLISAIEKLREEQSDGVDVASAIQSNVEQLIGTNTLLKQIQDRLPQSGNGSDYRGLLEQINTGIFTIANKKSFFRRTIDRFPWLKPWGYLSRRRLARAK